MTLAIMATQFPEFAPHFKASKTKKAIKGMKNDQKIKLLTAIIAKNAVNPHEKVRSFKEKLIKNLEKEKLSKEQKKAFKATQIQPVIPQAPAPLPQEDAATKKAKELQAAQEKEAVQLREKKERETRELNEKIETLTTSLETKLAIAFSWQSTLTTKEQFTAIALENLQVVKTVLTTGPQPFFTTDTISEMAGPSYTVMLDCTLFRLLQTSWGDTPLWLYGSRHVMTLSKDNDFDDFFDQLTALKTALMSLTQEERRKLIKKITDLADEQEVSPKVMKVFHAIGALRIPFEQNLMNSSERFAAIFMG